MSRATRYESSASRSAPIVTFKGENHPGLSVSGNMARNQVNAGTRSGTSADIGHAFEEIGLQAGAAYNSNGGTPREWARTSEISMSTTASIW